MQHHHFPEEKLTAQTDLLLLIAGKQGLIFNSVKKSDEERYARPVSHSTKTHSEYTYVHIWIIHGFLGFINDFSLVWSQIFLSAYNVHQQSCYDQDHGLKSVARANMQIVHNPLTCKDSQRSISLSEANIWTTPETYTDVCFPPVVRDIRELEENRKMHSWFSTNRGPFQDHLLLALRTTEAEEAKLGLWYN